jgi:hypothetical protein
VRDMPGRHLFQYDRVPGVPRRCVVTARVWFMRGVHGGNLSPDADVTVVRRVRHRCVVTHLRDVMHGMHRRHVSRLTDGTGVYCVQRRLVVCVGGCIVLHTVYGRHLPRLTRCTVMHQLHGRPGERGRRDGVYGVCRRDHQSNRRWWSMRDVSDRNVRERCHRVYGMRRRHLLERNGSECEHDVSGVSGRHASIDTRE